MAHNVFINDGKRLKHVFAKHRGPPDCTMTWLYLPKKSLNSLAAWSQEGRGWLCFHLHRNLSSLNILTVSNARKHMRDRERGKKVSLWQTSTRGSRHWFINCVIFSLTCSAGRRRVCATLQRPSDRGGRPAFYYHRSTFLQEGGSAWTVRLIEPRATTRPSLVLLNKVSHKSFVHFSKPSDSSLRIYMQLFWLFSVWSLQVIRRLSVFNHWQDKWLSFEMSKIVIR